VSGLSVSLFGPPQFKRGNEQISIQRRKDLALLIYLIVTSQPHSRDTLATLLWQDQGQADARSNLRKSLSRLKILLGEKSILVSQDRISLNPNLSINLDIARFESYIHQVREHKHARNGSSPLLCKECQQALEAAVHLYHSDFLEGFGLSDSPVFDEWQFFQSEGLRKNLAEVLELLTRQYVENEDYSTAIKHGLRWLALDRLHEPAHRHLMRLYALSGHRAAAKRQFEECKRILKEELDAEPEEETVQLFKDLEKKRLPQPFGTSVADAKRGVIDTFQSTTPSRKPHHFPVHPAPFIGREKELAELIRILRESPYRLLTLLGPGGSGKTRLALQVGATLDEDAGEPLRDEVWFVPLAPLTAPESILGSIKQSLGMAGHVNGSDSYDAFLSEIRGREMLLILDNFEHLLNADSSRLMMEILSASPRTKIVITSRERLNVEGEYVFPVGGLETPTEEALLSSRQENAVFTAFSALQLFEQCALRVQPDFQISAENYRSVVDICEVVQGMPLAIELAASWVQIYSPREIHQEIVHSLDFLQSNWRDLPDRQRSLRAVFDSSWSLLDKPTRPVIKALSIFRASFTREAAQAISGASAKTFLVLTHKSWIQRLANGRYQIHELLRQFAFEKLESEKATSELVMKHYSNYYAAYSARLWEDMKGTNQQRAFSEMEAEFDNIQVAWSWLVSAHDIETAVQYMLPILFHYTELRVKTVTLIHMLDLALASLPPYRSGHDRQIRQQEMILRSAKGAFLQGGDSLRASIPDVIFPIDTASIRRAWTLAQKHEAFQELGFWGILLCYVYGRMIQYDEAVRQLERMLPFFERTSQPWELATAYLHLLKLLIPNEPYASRRRKQLPGYLSHAKNIFVLLGDTINAGHIMKLWGDLKYQEHDLERAIHQWQLARDSFLNAGEWAAASVTLWQLCDACLQIGEFQKAFDGYREIAATFREHGLRLVQISALSKESYEKARHGDIEDALQIRRTCLEMILATGVTYQFAWNYWEMGDLMRVMGDIEAAAEWYERAYEIFDREPEHVGRSYYFRGMGDIALEKKNYESARAHFSTSADLAKSANHTWMICYSLSKLARAQVELQDVKSAKKNFRDAFQYGMKTLDKGIMLVAVMEYAEFCSKLGRDISAVELGSLVSHHFASWHETKKQASTLLDSIKSSLPRARFNEATEQGLSLDLWKTVEDLIKETAARTSKRLQSKKLIKA
jgi:predicted ATPase/DNA-binding SARP family transcriptional activator